MSFGRRLGDEVRLGARRGVGLVVAEGGDEVPVLFSAGSLSIPKTNHQLILR